MISVFSYRKDCATTLYWVVYIVSAWGCFGSAVASSGEGGKFCPYKKHPCLFLFFLPRERRCKIKRLTLKTKTNPVPSTRSSLLRGAFLRKEDWLACGLGGSVLTDTENLALCSLGSYKNSISRSVLCLGFLASPFSLREEKKKRGIQKEPYKRASQV